MQSESVAEETPLGPWPEPFEEQPLDRRTGTNRCRKRLLHLGDSLFSLFVITPVVVAHWRGTWGWMDLNGSHFPAWLCFVLGATLHTTFALLREPLNAALALERNAPKSRWSNVKRWFVKRMYTYAFSMGCLMHWRGGWNVMELYFAFNLLPALSISAICLVGLVMAKSVRNLLAPPFIILTDRKEAMFSFPTRFRMKITGSARKTLAKDEPQVPEIVNNLYAALVIGPLVICFWRGTWNLMDMQLFPEDEVLRMIILLVGGIGGHLFFMLLQTTLERWLDVEVRPMSFYLLSRVYTYIYGVMCVATWRGGWILIDRYSPPSLVFFMEASLVALLLLGSLQSFCNVAGAPFVNDSPDGYFDVPTYFKSKVSYAAQHANNVAEPAGTVSWEDEGDGLQFVRLVATATAHCTADSMRGSIAGIEDGITGTTPFIRPSYHGLLLELIDYLYASLVVAPLVVCYWRGTWNLMGEYIYPSDQTTSLVVSLAIGIVGHIVFNLFQATLRHHLNADKHRIAYYIGSRMYTVIYGAVCVNGWRGGWQLIDLYTTHDVLYVVLITLGCLFILACLKGVRNVMGTPFLIINDSRREYFDVPTYFKLTGSKDPGLYVLDCMFSVLVIGSLVVFVWRGLWVLLDLKLFPEDHGTSAWASIIIGYGVTGVTFSLQPLMRWTCDRLTGFWRVVVADLFLFFSFIGTINVWRGIWQALDTYFLPNDPLLSNWITHGAALLLLILLNCSNSVLVRGVYIDAEEPAGQCVVFPVYYIRLFFQKERKKKQRRLFDALERADINSTGGVLQDKKHHHLQQQQQQPVQQKEPPQQQQHHHIAADQNHQVIRNLEAVPLTIIDDPKSNGDHSSSQAPRK
uniref:Fuseless n=1 Tax=Anopheles epiroticus TaxID=199890 RepID=A0A182PAV5_9DIPT